MTPSRKDFSLTLRLNHLANDANLSDYDRAADRRGGALVDLGGADLRDDALRGSVTALSNSAARASNSGFGPFHRNCSRSSKRGMSVRSVASVRKSNARSHSRQSVSARALALVAFTRHSRQSFGICSRWPNLARTAADDFAPQPASPG